MLILGLETTGPFCSVALCKDGEVISQELGSERLNHLSNLIPMIDRGLEAGKTKLSDLDAMAVSVGPGSFTGIRIGVSTARAICQVTNLPLIPSSTLDSIAIAHENEATFVCPIMDARQNQTYSALYRGEDEVVEGRAYDIDEIFSKVREEVFDKAQDMEYSPSLFFVGDGVERYGDEIAKFADELDSRVDVMWQDIPQKADHLCMLAERLVATEGREAMTTDYDLVLPNYMRKSAPERKLEERLKK